MLILRNPAGKYIARLCVARITRWQMSMQSSRQVHCPPTLCWPYLANLAAHTKYCQASNPIARLRIARCTRPMDSQRALRAE